MSRSGPRGSRGLLFCGISFLAAAAALILTQLSLERGQEISACWLSLLSVSAFAVGTVQSGRKLPVLYKAGLIFVGWYAAGRVLQGEFCLTYSRPIFSNLLVTYLLALPFSYFWKERGEKWYRAAALILFAALLAFAVLALAAMFSGKTVTLPVLGSEFGFDKRYGDRRLFANAHPNISAALFLLALTLGGFLACSLKKKTARAAALLCCAVLLTAVIFTQSRTVMVQSCALVIGFGLLVWWQKESRRKLNGKKLLLAAAAVIVGCVLLYLCMPALISLYKLLGGNVKIRSMKRNISTLTGRTAIWKGVLELMDREPHTWLTGWLNSEMVWRLKEVVPGKEHAHNSYLQTLWNMGIPGLALAVFFTVRAVKNTVRIVFVHRAETTLSEKYVSMALMVLLIASVTEPYLFTEYFNLYNFVFFLLLGWQDTRLNTGAEEQYLLKKARD